MLQLRPYQVDIIEQARKEMRSGVRSILIQSPTGSGKTVLVAQMLKTSASRGMPSLFIVHRRELIKQSIDTFNEVGVPHGVIANHFLPNSRQLVQIAGIQTLTHRIGKIRKPRLVIWDECHHCAAAGWSKIHAQFPDAYHIGLTATPERLDGRGLGGYFKRIINGPSVRWLIDHGYLADYKIYAPSSINTEGLHTIMGDFVKSELASLVDKPTITGDAIKHYRKLADGKRAVVFCVSIEHSKHVVEQFQAAGISAAHVDGETPMEERDEKIEKFRYGIIKVIANVDLFGEGFDLPSLEVSILLRPTQSLGLFLQQSGRSLRPSCGKTHAVILDHAGNTMRHGLPDEERDWSLEGRGINKHGNKNKLSVRICPKCFAAQRSVVPTCAFCGFQFPIEGRQVKQAEGDLIEIDPKTFSKTRKREQGRSATLQDLIDLGRSRGYKRPELWAGFIFRARQARKLAGLR